MKKLRNNQTEEITLDCASIDYISEFLRLWLLKCGVRKRDSLRVRLTMED